MTNVSFRIKVLLILFSVMVFPMGLVGLILYNQATQFIIEQSSSIVRNSMTFSTNNIDFVLNAVMEQGSTIADNTELESAASITKPLNYSEAASVYKSVRLVLNEFITNLEAHSVIANSAISCYLYFPYQNTVLDTRSTFYEHIEASRVDFLNRIAEGQTEGTWFVTKQVNFYTLNNIGNSPDQNKMISFYKKVKSKSDGSPAILVINIIEPYLHDYYGKIQKGIPGDTIITSRTGKLITSSDRAITQENVNYILSEEHDKQKKGNYPGGFLCEVRNVSQFAVTCFSAETGWEYITLIPAESILGPVYKLRNFSLYILSGMVLLALGITLMLSHIFYSPLKKLVEGMRQIETGNLCYRIDDKRRDEYRQVFNGFNHMTGRLESLLDDLANERILTKEAQIKLLQAQINPHFLYNTLDSIYSIAKIYKVDEIAQMVAALSRFFRVSLSGGRNIVPLRSAVDLAVSYLTIQNIRFKNEIQYEIHIPDELMPVPVPKLLLQPLVENAIYHGIECQRAHGMLRIGAMCCQDKLNLTVEDNGVGMTPEKLEQLQNSIEDGSDKEGCNFALRNLNRQIRLYYGAGYGLRIDSQYGVGTTVSVALPIRTDSMRELEHV